MNNVLRAGLYIRVSHEEQVLHGDSIRTQTDALEEYCRNNGIKVVKHYIDEGISAGKPLFRRPALKQLLDDVQAGKIDILLMTKLDRYFRSVPEYYKVEEILIRNKAEWKTILEDYDSSTADGRLKINIMLSVAANERERTSERITFVFDNKVKNKEVISGSVPVGYIIQIDENGRKRLAKDPATKHIVEEFWDMMIKYNNLFKVGTYLNDKYGLNFLYGRWAKMRKNQLYTGEYRGVKDYCEPYISREDWLKAQSRPIKKAQKNRVYLFTGLMRCSECGRTLCSNCTVKKTKKGIIDYKSYKCHRGNTKTCTNTFAISEVKLEQYLLDNLAQLINLEIQAVEIEKATPKPKPKTDVAKLKERLRKLSVVYMDGAIDDEEYFARSAELKALIDQASQEIPQVERDITPLQELLKTDWRALYDVMTLENKRRFWRGIIKEIQMDGKAVKKVIFL